MHPLRTRVREKWYPAYTIHQGRTKLYAVLMPYVAETEGELPDSYIKVLANPKHKPDTAIRIFDVMIPREYKHGGQIQVHWFPNHFLIGDEDECITFVGRAQPCVDHDRQLGYEKGIKGPIGRVKNKMPKEKCSGIHPYLLGKAHQKLVFNICREYASVWDTINTTTIREYEFSIYLLRVEDVNTEDLKTLTTTLNKYPGWTLRRLKNGFNLFYDNGRTIMRKAFHISKVYDAIDFVEDITPVWDKWSDTKNR
jgi:hypothetical protein